MEKNKHSIIPVTLHDDNTNRQRITKTQPQKIVAHLKNSQTELLDYRQRNVPALPSFVPPFAMKCTSH